MFLLILAAQLSSTNCIPDYVGGMMCTTTSQPPMPPMTQPTAPRPRSGGGDPVNNFLSIFGADAETRHRKAVTKLLAKGDCPGAETYALEKGELRLAERVQEFCEKKARQSDPAKEVWVVPEDLYIDPPKP